ncbi:hypothetical protein ACVGWK_00250 [Enterobacter sichuanensis]
MVVALIKTHFAQLMATRKRARWFVLDVLHPTLNYKQNHRDPVF